MTAVEIEGLWLEYGDRVILENLRLEIAPHSFCAIAGPSGCGKSSLLRLLLGQERPTRGQIRIDGAPLPPEPGPDVGIVFQRYSVFPHLTALENAALGLELARAPRLGRLFGAARRRAFEEAEQILAAVGLQDALHQHPHTLSGGMRQRLSLAQALIRKPRVLLLDEAFGALDAGTRDSIHELVLQLWHETRMTVFMVTHDLREAFALGTRVLVLDKLRHDPHAPERFGAGITYDLDLRRRAAEGPGASPHPVPSIAALRSTPVPTPRAEPARPASAR